MEAFIGLIVWIVIIVALVVRGAQRTSGANKAAAERQRLAAQQQYLNQFQEPKKQPKQTKKTSDLRKTEDVRNTSKVRKTDSTAKVKREDECEVHGVAHEHIDHTGHINDIDVDSPAIMDAVYNAMVCGPEVHLPSGRDFIAEGMDMINSFSVIEEG